MHGVRKCDEQEVDVGLLSAVNCAWFMIVAQAKILHAGTGNAGRARAWVWCNRSLQVVAGKKGMGVRARARGMSGSYYQKTPMAWRS